MSPSINKASESKQLDDLAAIDPEGFQPESNTGGKVLSPQSTFVHWCEFRTRQALPDVIEGMSRAYGSDQQLRIASSRSSPKRFFERQHIIALGHTVVAVVDAGGEHQRGWSCVQISGSRCSAIVNWTSFLEMGNVGAELRRLDITLDLEPGRLDHEAVLAAYPQAFMGRGRPPSIDKREKKNSNSDGRSVMIGRRGSDKVLRAYEKGATYRVEVEFRAATRELPWTMLMDLDRHFAGAYPFCADLIGAAVHPAVLRTQRQHAQASLEDRLAHARRSYGPTLNTALAAGYTRDELMLALTGGALDARLVEAGILGR